MYNGDIQSKHLERVNNMTNNNNKKPINCACKDMTCESFVAGNQCFRCEQVDNRKAGFTFDDTVDEWNEWFQQVQQRIAEHKVGPNPAKYYGNPSRYA